MQEQQKFFQDENAVNFDEVLPDEQPDEEIIYDWNGGIISAKAQQTKGTNS